MIFTVLRKELLALCRDGRAVVLVLGFAVLLAGALGAAGEQHRQAAGEKAEVTRITRAQWDAQGDKHPHRGAHFGLYVLRPDSVLAAFDPGLDAYVGQALWLEPHRRNLSRFDPAADALPALRLGELTPAFVLSTLLPLLLIALGFAAVSHEREQGTLRMLHGIGIAPSVLVAGKVAALLVVATALLVLAFAALALLAWQGGGVDGDAWVRGAWLFAACLLNAAIFALLAVGVSTATRSSRLALLVLVALWFASAFVVPRLGAALAAQLTPMPTPTQFWEAIHHDYTQGLPGDGPLDARVAAYEAQLLREHGVDRLEDLPVGANALRRLFRDAYADKVHAVHFAALWQRQQRQQAILRWTGLLSPVVAMRSLSSGLSGTDLAHQRHFEDAAEHYRQSVNTRIDEWDAQHSRGIASYDARYAGDALWRSIPAFAYAPARASFALGQGRVDAAMLLAWLAMLVVATGIAARSLRP